MPNVSQTSLLAQPYRDRQVIVVSKTVDSEMTLESVRIGDYISLNPFKELRKVKDVLSKKYWTDPRNYGLYGYLFDRLRGKGATGGTQKVDHFVRISADVAERIFRFPAGHPRYDMVYVGHPLRPTEYVPIATFHRRIFEDKFNELITLLSSLGATKMSISYVSDRKRRRKADASLNLVEGLLTGIKGSVKVDTHSSSEGKFDADFTPVGAPSIPEDLVWLVHEPTWQSVADTRLDAGLTKIDVALRYEDDFGIDAKLAVGLEKFGLSIGGEFTEFERAVWTFHGTFAPLENGSSDLA
jgi:hypothetical protein